MRKVLTAGAVVFLFGMFIGSRAAMYIKNPEAISLVDYSLMFAGLLLLGINWRSLWKTLMTS